MRANPPHSRYIRLGMDKPPGLAVIQAAPGPRLGLLFHEELGRGLERRAKTVG
jgi:hypothetical protein